MVMGRRGIISTIVDETKNQGHEEIVDAVGFGAMGCLHRVPVDSQQYAFQQ
jgi:hypothetical protein